VRDWLDRGGPFSKEKLVRQVRLRSIATDRITRVEPDVEIRRRRVRS